MRHTVQTAVIWVVVVAAAFGLWEIRVIILLFFAAILLAILLRLIAFAISGFMHMPEGLCLAIAAAMLVAIVAAVAWLFESHLSSQFADLLDKVKAGTQNLNIAMQNSDMKRLSGGLTAEGTSFITGIIK